MWLGQARILSPEVSRILPGCSLVLSRCSPDNQPAPGFFRFAWTYVEMDYHRSIHRILGEYSRHYFSMLFKEVGDVSVSSIKKQEINKLILSLSEDLKKRGRGNHAANAMLRSLKALFNYGINIYDLDIKNPCNGIGMYSIDNRIKYIPSDDDIETVKSLCDTEQLRLVQFVIDTGARINEPLCMTFADVHDDYVVLYT